MANEQQTILVVDDEKANISVLLELLKTEYRIPVAKDGHRALEIAFTEKPDLMLLDILMPEMDGYDVLQQLKADPRTLSIPVIFLTAKSEVADEAKGLSQGAVDYITKPISPPILLTRIKTHLRLKEANDQLKKQAEILETKVQERTKQLSGLNQALTKFVPKAFLEAIGKSDIMGVRLGDHMYGEMSILFSDIRDYTTISETMTPEEVFGFTIGYQSRMTPLIREHYGFVQQYQGDAIVTVFPRSCEDALKAGIAIQKRVAAYNRERQEKHREPIQVGVGLHAGPLMVGVIGDDERWESGVPSDTVNTAARLEGLTKYYGVLIVVSETVIKGLHDPDRYPFRFLDTVQVKGKTTPLSVYEVFDADPVPVAESKLKAMSLFSEGQQHFFARNFSKAVKCFADVLTFLPADATTRQYFRRASKCLLEGVPENWEGIQGIAEK